MAKDWFPLMVGDLHRGNVRSAAALVAGLMLVFGVLSMLLLWTVAPISESSWSIEVVRAPTFVDIGYPMDSISVVLSKSTYGTDVSGVEVTLTISLLDDVVVGSRTANCVNTSLDPAGVFRRVDWAFCRTREYKSTTTTSGVAVFANITIPFGAPGRYLVTAFPTFLAASDAVYETMASRVITARNNVLFMYTKNSGTTFAYPSEFGDAANKLHVGTVVKDFNVSVLLRTNRRHCPTEWRAALVPLTLSNLQNPPYLLAPYVDYVRDGLVDVDADIVNNISSPCTCVTNHTIGVDSVYELLCWFRGVSVASVSSGSFRGAAVGGKQVLTLDPNFPQRLDVVTPVCSVRVTNTTLGVTADALPVRVAEGDAFGLRVRVLDCGGRPVTGKTVYLAIRPSRSNPSVAGPAHASHPLIHPKFALDGTGVTDSLGYATFRASFSVAGGVGLYHFVAVCDGVIAEAWDAFVPGATELPVNVTSRVTSVAVTDVAAGSVVAVSEPWLHSVTFFVFEAGGIPLARKFVSLKSNISVSLVGSNATVPGVVVTHSEAVTDAAGFASISDVMVIACPLCNASSNERIAVSLDVVVDGLVFGTIRRVLRHSPALPAASTASCAVLLPLQLPALIETSGSIGFVALPHTGAASLSAAELAAGAAPHYWTRAIYDGELDDHLDVVDDDAQPGHSNIELLVEAQIAELTYTFLDVACSPDASRFTSLVVVDTFFHGYVSYNATSRRVTSTLTFTRNISTIEPPTGSLTVSDFFGVTPLHDSVASSAQVYIENVMMYENVPWAAQSSFDVDLSQLESGTVAVPMQWGSALVNPILIISVPVQAHTIRILRSSFVVVNGSYTRRTPIVVALDAANNTLPNTGLLPLVLYRTTRDVLLDNPFKNNMQYSGGFLAGGLAPNTDSLSLFAEDLFTDSDGMLEMPLLVFTSGFEEVQLQARYCAMGDDLLIPDVCVYEEPTPLLDKTQYTSLDLRCEACEDTELMQAFPGSRLSGTFHLKFVERNVTENRFFYCQAFLTALEDWDESPNQITLNTIVAYRYRIADDGSLVPWSFGSNSILPNRFVANSSQPSLLDAYFQLQVAPTVAPGSYYFAVDCIGWRKSYPFRVLDAAQNILFDREILAENESLSVGQPLQIVVSATGAAGIPASSVPVSLTFKSLNPQCAFLGCGVLSSFTSSQKYTDGAGRATFAFAFAAAEAGLYNITIQAAVPGTHLDGLGIVSDTAARVMQTARATKLSDVTATFSALPLTSPAFAVVHAVPLLAATVVRVSEQLQVVEQLRRTITQEYDQPAAAVTRTVRVQNPVAAVVVVRQGSYDGTLNFQFLSSIKLESKATVGVDASNCAILQLLDVNGRPVGGAPAEVTALPLGTVELTLRGNGSFVSDGNGLVHMYPLTITASNVGTYSVVYSSNGAGSVRSAEFEITNGWNLSSGAVLRILSFGAILCSIPILGFGVPRGRLLFWTPLVVASTAALVFAVLYLQGKWEELGYDSPILQAFPYSLFVVGGAALVAHIVALFHKPYHARADLSVAYVKWHLRKQPPPEAPHKRPTGAANSTWERVQRAVRSTVGSLPWQDAKEEEEEYSRITKACPIDLSFVPIVVKIVIGVGSVAVFAAALLCIYMTSRAVDQLDGAVAMLPVNMANRSDSVAEAAQGGVTPLGFRVGVSLLIDALAQNRQFSDGSFEPALESLWSKNVFDVLDTVRAEFLSTADRLRYIMYISTGVAVLVMASVMRSLWIRSYVGVRTVWRGNPANVAGGILVPNGRDDNEWITERSLYIGTQIVHFVAVYFVAFWLLTLLLTLATSLLILEQFWSLLSTAFISVLSLSTAVIVFQVAVELLRRYYNVHSVLWPAAFSVWEGVALVVGIFEGFAVFVARVIKLILLTLWNFSNLTASIKFENTFSPIHATHSRGFWAYDNAHVQYSLVVVSEANFRNPMFLVFSALCVGLCGVKRERELLAAGDTHAALTHVAASLRRQLIAIDIEKPTKAFRRVQQRFWLWTVLTKNPVMRNFRKHRLGMPACLNAALTWKAVLDVEADNRSFSIESDDYGNDIEMPLILSRSFAYHPAAKWGSSPHEEIEI